MHTRTAVLTAALIGIAGATAPATATTIGFSGTLAPALWTVGGSPDYGSVDVSGAPDSITLTGGDNGPAGPNVGACVAGFDGPCVLTFMANNVKTPISFHWAYHSDDFDGPGFDLFGVIVDGNRIQLSDIGGAPDQSGDAAFSVATSFGFYIDCTDCFPGSGAATVTISDVKAPEPASLALFGLGVLGLVTARRRMRG